MTHSIFPPIFSTPRGLQIRPSVYENKKWQFRVRTCLFYTYGDTPAQKVHHSRISQSGNDGGVFWECVDGTKEVRVPWIGDEKIRVHM